MAALEITGFSKSYPVGFWKKRQVPALTDLHLSVEEGEVFGCLGPNGAGKTTTLKLLLGLVFPTAGSARIFGRPYDDPEVKTQLGFLPEQPYFYDHLTARELLDYYAQLSAVPAKDRKRRVDEVLSRVGLAAEGSKQLRKFSKGMLQRVGIAQAIVHDPRMVILDEPMSGLDPVGRHEVRELIQGLKDQGKTVFFSTHILSDAEALCDRVAVLHRGRLRAVGVVADLTANARGQVELLCAGNSAEAALKSLGAACRHTADALQARLPQAQLDAAIDAVRRSGSRLISVNPVQGSLEDYFLEQLGGADR